MKPFQPYHLVWLSVHPERTEQWLRERLTDGFHVHHIDGNHENNDPRNLVLIEAGDHMMLHNGSSRLLWRPPSAKKSATGGRPKKVVKTIEEMRAELATAEAKANKLTGAQRRYIKQRDAGRARFQASLIKGSTSAA